LNININGLLNLDAGLYQILMTSFRAAPVYALLNSFVDRIEIIMEIIGVIATMLFSLCNSVKGNLNSAGD